MKWVDLEFLGTYAYYGENNDPFIFSDIPQAMFNFGYPNETRWKLITTLDAVLSHIVSGVEVNQEAYVRGFVDSCEIALLDGQNIVKRQAVSKMSIDGGSAPDAEVTAKTKSIWVKSAIETLARGHKKTGLELNRSYQIGSYQTHQKLCAVIEMHRDNQLTNSTNKGSGINVEF